MAWTLTARGHSEGTYAASANVGDTFTPAENDIIIAFNVMSDATPHTTVTGWGATWVQILAPTAPTNFTAWAARMGASPGSSTVNLDFGGGSTNYDAGVIQIAGANTTAAIGVGGSNLFRQVVASTGYNPASPLSITALSAFASATNLSLTLGAISANLPLAPKSGFTELLEGSGAAYNPNIWAAYKTSEDTAHQLLEQTAGDFDYKNLVGIAIEVLEAAAAGSMTRTPSVGALALAGLAATVAISGAVTRIPTVGSLELNGNAPTVSVSGGHIRTPVAGSLAFTGLTVIQDLTVAAPVVGALTLTGNAPTVLRGTIIQPTVGALSFTGVAPSLQTPRTITPTVGALTLTGIASSVTVGSSTTMIIPGVGSLAFTGNVASLIQSSPLIRPGTGSLILTGSSPGGVSATGGGYLTRPYSFNWWTH